MTIALQGSVASTTFSSAATSVNATLPSGITAGELLLAQINISGTGSPPAVTPPSGWAAFAGAGNGVTSGISKNQLFYKIADGTESGTVAFTWSSNTSQGTVVIARYSGVDNTTPQDADCTSATGSSNSLSHGGITTATANACVVLAVAASGGLASLSWGSPLAARWNAGTKPAAGSDAIYASAGATGTLTASWTTSRIWLAVAVALRPASSGTTQTGALASAAQATLAPNAHLTAQAQEPVSAVASVAPNAHLTAQAQEPIVAAATLSPQGRRILAGRLAVSAAATLAPNAHLVAQAQAALSAAASLSTLGYRVRSGAAAIVAGATLAPNAHLTAQAQEPIAAAASLAPLAYRVRSAAMAVQAAATVTPAGRLASAAASAAMAPVTTLSPRASKIAAGRLAVSAGAALSPVARLTAAALSPIAAAASLAPLAYRVRSGRELVAAAATLTPNTLGITTAKAALFATATLTPKSSNPLRWLAHTPGLFISSIQVNDMHSEIRDTGGWATTAQISWNSAQSQTGVMNYGYVDSVINTFLSAGIKNFRIEIDTNHNAYCWHYLGSPSVVPSRAPRDCAGNVAGGWYYFVYHLVDYLLQHSAQYTILGVGQLNEAMAAFSFYIAGYLDDLVTPAYPSRWSAYLDAQHYLYNAVRDAAAAHGTETAVLNDGIGSQGLCMLRACVKWRAAAGDPTQEQAIVDELNAYGAYSGMGSYRFPFTYDGLASFQTQIVDTVNPTTGHSDYTEFLGWWDTCYCLPEDSGWYDDLQLHFYARPEYLQPMWDWFHAQLAAVGADRAIVAGEIGTVWNETISHVSHDDARYGRWIMATLLSAAGEGTKWFVFWMLTKQKEHQNQEMLGVYDGDWKDLDKKLLPPFVATPYSQPALRLVLSVLHGVVRVQKRHPGDGSYFLWRFERADGTWFLGGYVPEGAASVSGIDLGTGLSSLWQRDYTNAYTSINPASVTLTNVPVVFQPELVLWPTAASGGGLSAGPLAVVQQAQAVVSSVATLAPAARLTARALGAVAAAATLAPAARRLRQALTTPIPAAASLSPNGHLTARARVALAAVATLAPAGGQLGTVTARAAITAAAGLSAPPVLVAGGQVQMAATASVIAWAGLVTGQAALAAQAALTPGGRAVAAALLAIAGRATLAPAASLRTRAAAPMVAQATLSPRGVERAGGAVLIAAAASMSPSGYVQWTTGAAATLAAQASLTPAGLATLSAHLSLAAQAALSPGGSTPGPVLGAAQMAAAAALAARASTHEPVLGTALVSIAATLAVAGRETAAAQARMEARAEWSAGVRATSVGVALLLVAAQLAARGTALTHLHTSGSISGPGRRSTISGPARRGSISGWQ